MAKPDDDYLDDAVKETIASLIKYDSSKKISNKGFIY